MSEHHSDDLPDLGTIGDTGVDASPGVDANTGVDADSVMWNVPPDERSGKPLLVMMHGLGSHEGDLFGLNRFLPQDLAVALP